MDGEQVKILSELRMGVKNQLKFPSEEGLLAGKISSAITVSSVAE